MGRRRGGDGGGHRAGPRGAAEAAQLRARHRASRPTRSAQRRCAARARDLPVRVRRPEGARSPRRMRRSRRTRTTPRFHALRGHALAATGGAGGARARLRARAGARSEADTAALLGPGPARPRRAASASARSSASPPRRPRRATPSSGIPCRLARVGRAAPLPRPQGGGDRAPRGPAVARSVRWRRGARLAGLRAERPETRDQALSLAKRAVFFGGTPEAWEVLAQVYRLRGEDEPAATAQARAERVRAARAIRLPMPASRRPLREPPRRSGQPRADRRLDRSPGPRSPSSAARERGGPRARWCGFLASASRALRPVCARVTRRGGRVAGGRERARAQHLVARRAAGRDQGSSSGSASRAMLRIADCDAPADAQAQRVFVERIAVGPLARELCVERAHCAPVRAASASQPAATACSSAEGSTSSEAGVVLAAARGRGARAGASPRAPRAARGSSPSASLERVARGARASVAGSDDGPRRRALDRILRSPRRCARRASRSPRASRRRTSSDAVERRGVGASSGSKCSKGSARSREGRAGAPDRGEGAHLQQVAVVGDQRRALGEARERPLRRARAPRRRPPARRRRSRRRSRAPRPMARARVLAHAQRLRRREQQQRAGVGWYTLHVREDVEQARRPARAAARRRRRTAPSTAPARRPARGARARARRTPACRDATRRRSTGARAARRSRRSASAVSCSAPRASSRITRTRGSDERILAPPRPR